MSIFKQWKQQPSKRFSFGTIDSRATIFSWFVFFYPISIYYDCVAKIVSPFFVVVVHHHQTTFNNNTHFSIFSFLYFFCVLFLFFFFVFVFVVAASSNFTSNKSTFTHTHTLSDHWNYSFRLGFSSRTVPGDRQPINTFFLI